MAWIYFLALEEFPLLSKSGLDQLPTAKSIPTVNKSCSPVFPTDQSLTRQFGMIFKRCRMMGETGQESISYTGDSHARELVLQDMEKAWKMSEADYIRRWYAWPKKSNHLSYSLRTYRPFRHEGAYESLEKLPKWGMTVDGVLYPLRPLEPYIDEKGGSYWPTPQARAQTDTPSERNRNTPCLHSAVMMATPTASQSGKSIRSPSPSRLTGKHGEDLQDSIGRLNPESIGKKLSVEFVELLMGYPSKWTDCEGLEMP